MWGMEYYIGIRALNGDGRGVGAVVKKRGSMRQGKGVGVWGECSLAEGGVSRTGVLDSGAWAGRMGE